MGAEPTVIIIVWSEMRTFSKKIPEVEKPLKGGKIAPLIATIFQKFQNLRFFNFLTKFELAAYKLL